jgi:NAD+ synthase (glutamine-hydrolysing)
LGIWRNKIQEVIPQRIFIKPPSAELKENQKDEEKLPPYEILDRILMLFIEEDLSKEEIKTVLGNEEVVDKVLGMIRNAEFKRKLSPLGPKVTKRAFYRERRYPNINDFNQ